MAYQGMIVETISYTGHNGDKISAYAARPAGKGPFPGICLIHHNPGWDEFYCETTRKFAHHGYAAISLNCSSVPGKENPTTSRRRCAPKAAFPTRRRSATPRAR